ncbi:DUF5050 domain-containing protein [Candidatus Contubernalis alkaliaceticus]|uniref:DUF5050 domain-containing protein n=1 Tax=Candidatus Contubernalis alkaliaceticus TaxID=338645 RepID=UPI001F4BF5B7|nr:DUF5050 domain-containing protein [Candidatus Contubernalis alkalaceticus]UNC91112.1 DUF5050 domain-containing protein [Candidatus Contubernalis alkalaceticus]
MASQNNQFCPSCGGKLEPGDKFCAGCGISCQDDPTKEGPVQPEAQTKSNKIKPVFILIAALIIIPLVFLAARTAVTTGTKKAIEDKLALAEKYLLDQEYEQAILAYDEVIEIDPRVEKAYTGLAKAHVGLWNMDSAEEVLKQGIEIVPNTIPLRSELAGIYLRQGKQEEAREVFLEILEDDEKEQSAYRGLARVYESLRDIDKMVEILEKVIFENPGYSQNYSLLAEAYVKQGRIEEALEMVKTALDMDMEDYYAYAVLEMIYGGNWEELLIEAEGILNREKQSAVGMRLKFYGLFKSQCYEDVTALHDELHDAVSSDIEIVLTALSFLRRDDDNRAEELVGLIDIEHVESLIVLNYLAHYFLETGDQANAQRMAVKAIYLDSYTDYFYLLMFELTEDERYLELLMVLGKEEWVRGNTTGNISNYGLAALQGNWVYFSNEGDGGKLYRMNLDGSDLTRLNEDNSKYINVVGSWVYYANVDDDYKVYKIKTDGSGLTRLNDDYSRSINVVGEWVYYIEYGDYDGYEATRIYKMKTDGTERNRLNDRSACSMMVMEDWVYYTTYEHMLSYCGALYKVRIDGSGDTAVNSDWGKTVIADGWAYYCHFQDEFRVYKVNLDGSGRTRLNDDWSRSINVAGDWVYFIIGDPYYGPIYRMKTDGSSRTQLNNDASDSINIIGDWLYYSNNLDNSLYRMKLDGSQRQKIFAPLGNGQEQEQEPVTREPENNQASEETNVPLPFNRDDFTAAAIRLNMTVNEVKEILGEPITTTRYDEDGYYDFIDDMVYNFGEVSVAPDLENAIKVIAISVNTPGVPGPRGIQVGDTMESVIRKFPDNNNPIINNGYETYKVLYGSLDHGENGGGVYYDQKTGKPALVLYKQDFVVLWLRIENELVSDIRIAFAD